MFAVYLLYHGVILRLWALSTLCVSVNAPISFEVQLVLSLVGTTLHHEELALNCGKQCFVQERRVLDRASCQHRCCSCKGSCEGGAGSNTARQVGTSGLCAAALLSCLQIELP